MENIHGLEVSISTTAKNREEGLELFRFLGFPFKPTEAKK
jgi:ribosomal protein L5